MACSLGLVALILLYRQRKKIIGGVILRVAGSGAELHQTPRAAPEAPQSLATPHDGGPDRISAEQWALFDERGFVVLPREQVFELGELEALQARLNLLVGRADSATVQLDAPMVQLRYADAGEGMQTLYSRGSALRYRSLESLGLDPLVEAYVRKPLFDAACQRVYGATTPVASLRTVLSSQPSRHAGGAVDGTARPWQQDRCSFLGEHTLETPTPPARGPEPARPPTRPPLGRCVARTPHPHPSLPVRRGRPRPSDHRPPSARRHHSTERRCAAAAGLAQAWGAQPRPPLRTLDGGAGRTARPPSTAPHRTESNRTAPHRAAPRHPAPHRTPPPSSPPSSEQVTRHVAPATPLALLLRPGEVALVHSWLVRSSGPNAATVPRRDRQSDREERSLSRALSVSYMDARSRLACGALREASCPEAPLPCGGLEFPLVFARASSGKRERAARTPRLTSPAAILSRARQVLHAARGACRNMDI